MLSQRRPLRPTGARAVATVEGPRNWRQRCGVRREPGRFGPAPRGRMRQADGHKPLGDSAGNRPSSRTPRDTLIQKKKQNIAASITRNPLIAGSVCRRLPEGESKAGRRRELGFQIVYHYKSQRTDQAAVERRIKEIAETRVRYGYRRVHVLLRRERWVINRCPAGHCAAMSREG